MRIVLFIFFVLFFLIAKGDDTIPNNYILGLPSLQEYNLSGKKDVSIKLSFDVKTILVDLIPKIVLKNRRIRYDWDRRDQKRIFIFNRFIKYLPAEDNIKSIFHLADSNNFKLDTNYILSNQNIDMNSLKNWSYTNLSCLDDFGYKFVFVDDIFMADFVLSSFDALSENKIQLCVWNMQNFSEHTKYTVEAELPWNIDCFKTTIVNEDKMAVNLNVKEIEKLEKKRQSVYD